MATVLQVPRLHVPFVFVAHNKGKCYTWVSVGKYNGLALSSIPDPGTVRAFQTTQESKTINTAVLHADMSVDTTLFLLNAN